MLTYIGKITINFEHHLPDLKLLIQIESVNTEVLPSTSPTRNIETLRTPGVARDQEYIEQGMYAENILTVDTKLL